MANTRYNYDYGKLVNGRIEYAPMILTYNNKRYSRPKHEVYISCGWKHIVYSDSVELTAEENEKGWYLDSVYTETEEEIIVSYEKKISSEFDF